MIFRRGGSPRLVDLNELTKNGGDQMATLEKKHAVKVITDILVDIYESEDYTQYCFPERFEDFGYEIVKRLYNRFKYIEGNPIIFERTMGLDALPIKMNNSFELVESE